MKKRTRILATAMAGALAFTLAACGGAGGAASTGASGAAGTGASGAGDAAKDPVTIVYYACWNETEPSAQAIQYAIELYTADNPNVTVDVQWIGRSNQDTVGAAIHAGEQIDVFDNVLYTVDTTLFAPIDELLEKPAYGNEDITVKESIPAAYWDSNTQAQEAAELTDATYGVPMSPFVASIFYNKDLFEQAGITTAPGTWEEFIAACEALKAAGIAPITTDDAYAFLMPAFLTSRMFGQEGVLEMAKDPKSPLWTDGRFLKVLEYLQQLADNGYYSSAMPTNKYPAGQQEFAMANAAMYFNASWFPGEVLETAGEDFAWGSFGFPVLADGVEDATAICLGSVPMFVSAKSEHPQEAMELLRYIVSAPVQERLSGIGFAPITVGTPWPGPIAEQAAIVEQGKSTTLFSANFVSDYINGAVMPEMTKIMTGNTDAQTAYAAIEKAASAY